MVTLKRSGGKVPRILKLGTRLTSFTPRPLNPTQRAPGAPSTTVKQRVGFSLSILFDPQDEGHMFL
jgi:hypothetical protein